MLNNHEKYLEFKILLKLSRKKSEFFAQQIYEVSNIN